MIIIWGLIIAFIGIAFAIVVATRGKAILRVCRENNRTMKGDVFPEPQELTSEVLRKFEFYEKECIRLTQQLELSKLKNDKYLQRELECQVELNKKLLKQMEFYKRQCKELKKENIKLRKMIGWE